MMERGRGEDSAQLPRMELGRGQVTPPASSRPALAARQHAMTGPHNGKTVKRCRSLFPDGLHRDRFRRVLLNPTGQGKSSAASCSQAKRRRAGCGWFGKPQCLLRTATPYHRLSGPAVTIRHAMPPSPKHSRQKRDKGSFKVTPYLSISTSMASLERLRKVVKAVDALRGSCLSSILPIRPTTAGVKMQMARHRLASVTLKRGTWPPSSWPTRRRSSLLG